MSKKEPTLQRKTLFTPEEEGFDSLIPPLEMDGQSPFSKKEDLVKEFEKYRNQLYLCCEKKGKVSKSVKAIKHRVFNLKYLQAVSDIRAFRFVINTHNEMLLGAEGSAGVTIPAHYVLSKINLEAKELPQDYYDSEGCVARAAGRIYLNEAGKIYKMDTNSGGFRPNLNSAVLALATILLCAPEMLADVIEFDVLNSGGGYELTHSFSLEELNLLVLKQFNEAEQSEIIAKNAVAKVVNFERERTPSSDVQHRAAASAAAVISGGPLHPSGFDEGDLAQAQADEFSSPKKQSASGALVMSTPMKRPALASRRLPAGESPAKAGVFSTPPRGKAIAFGHGQGFTP